MYEKVGRVGGADKQNQNNCCKILKTKIEVNRVRKSTALSVIALLADLGLGQIDIRAELALPR